MDRDQYRALQEDFVSNCSGTTLFEVSNVVSSFPVGFLLYRALLARAGCLNFQASWLVVLFEYLLLVFPLLLTMTIGSDLALLINAIILISSAAMFIPFLSPSPKTTTLPRRRPFVTAYRASVNIATAIAILAVDFPIFPRRFAKTETYGTAVMDVGVGAFIVSNGIVAPEARAKVPGKDRVGETVIKAIRGSFPLLVLGFGRLAVIKLIDYQEHVTEYGIHWNFFFTLAVVKILSASLFECFPRHWSLGPSIAGLLVGIVYQVLLLWMGWREFLLEEDGSRAGFVEANREGIASCLGYLALYMLAVQLGQFLSSAKDNVKGWLSCLVCLIVLDVLLYGILFLCVTYVEPVSRRMANLSFVIWQLAYNVYLVAVFLSVDLASIFFTQTLKCGTIIESISQNQLFYFLLANVLTGAVNLSMYTVTASFLHSFVVVSAYMIALTVILSTFYLYNVKTKIW